MRLLALVLLIVAALAGFAALTSRARRSLTQPYPEDEGSLFV